MRTALSCLFVAMLPVLAQPQAPGELLPNPGFALDTAGRGLPDGWTGGNYGTEAKLELDADVFRSGGQSVRIDGALRSRAGLHRGFRERDTDPGDVYLLSAWVRVEGTSTHAMRTSVRITSVDEEGSVLKSDYRLAPAGPYDWTHCEWQIVLPPATRRFNIVLFHHGEGTAWWDDASLRRARPIAALAPAQDANLPDANPVFRWEPLPGDGVLELTDGDTFHPERTRRFPVTGTTFQLPEPLPSGRYYQWRVLAADGDRLAVTVAPGPEGGEPQVPRFFAGTWTQRMAGLEERLAPKRTLLPKLRDFAERNRMWDQFSLLADTLAQGEALVAEEPADPRLARAQLDEALDELAYTIPWWETIFLDDAALFAGLDLDRPGLETVRNAVAATDWTAARQALLDYYRQRTEPDYYGRYRNPPLRNPAVTANPAADRLLEHQFAIHSYKEPYFDMGPDFNWHVNPIIDREWPTRIHRHFHWTTISSAYWQTGTEKYAEEIVQQLLDWAKDNPMEAWQPERGRFAWSTLNATIRIYSTWLNAWHRVKDSPAWNADAQFVFLTSLREHGRFLMRRAARHGNWVVAESQGLVELGVMFPEFREADEWREEGYRRLRREIDIQVLSDGVHVERTPGYHGMTLSCFMAPVRLGLLNGVEIEGRERFVEKLEKMHEFYLYGVKPDGRMEQIGSSRMTAVDRPLRRGWDMFRREDMLWVASGGSEGRPPIHRSYAFDGAGFYVSRSAWNDPEALWSILNWRTGFVGHCHEDMGHISIHAYGANLLIDTGTYSYARPMRLPFLETVGHNTVLVNRETQKRRGALDGHWVSTDLFDYFHGRHDNSEPLLHERTLAFRQPGSAGPGYWLVVDHLTGEGNHRLDQRWHPTEKLTGRIEGASVVYTGAEGQEPQPSIVVANLPQPGLRTALTEGAVSYSWYTKQEVEVAQFTLDGPAPAGFVTVLYPTPPGREPARIELEALSVAGDAVALRAVIEDNGRSFHDLWIVRPRDTGLTTVGPLETDAQIVHLRLEDGQRSWFLAEGRILRHAGEPLFEAAATVAGAGAAPSPQGTDLTCTAATAVHFAATGATTLNGAPVEAERRQGLLFLDQVPEIVVPPVPRAPGGPRFEIETAAEQPEASSFLEVLPKTATLPRNAVRLAAEDFVGQGGGAVRVVDDKTASHGNSFMHWDRAGHWLEWRLELPEAQRAHLLARACTAQMQALRKLTVNGTTPTAAESMEFAGTGGYSNHNDDWRIFRATDREGKPLVLELPAGETILRLENIDGQSLNLNWLALVPAP